MGISFVQGGLVTLVEACPGIVRRQQIADEVVRPGDATNTHRGDAAELTKRDAPARYAFVDQQCVNAGVGEQSHRPAAIVRLSHRIARRDDGFPVIVDVQLPSELRTQIVACAAVGVDRHADNASPTAIGDIRIVTGKRRCRSRLSPGARALPVALLAADRRRTR